MKLGGFAMNLARQTTVAFLLLLATLGVALGFQEKEFSRTVPFDSGDTLNLKTYKGSIHLSVWDRSEVSIYAKITPPEGEDADYAARVVAATEVAVRRNAGAVSIESDYDKVPSRRGWANGWFGDSKNLAFVHYDIKAPKNLKLNLDDYKSTIEIYGFTGRFDVETYKGELKASDLNGRFRLDTYKGHADLTGLAGSLDVETYKGEVSVQAVHIDGDSRLQTHKGSIALAIPANQGLEVDTDLGRKASFESDFPGVGEVERSSRSKDQRRRVINDGGPRLAVSTYKGDIRLRRW